MTRTLLIVLVMLVACGAAPAPANGPVAPTSAAVHFKIGTVVKDCAECPPMVAIPAVGKRTIALGTPPLFVARHELTWREYLNAVRGRGCGAPLIGGVRRHDVSDPTFDDDQPVSGVTLIDFQCYLDWINAKTGKRYRLPSNAEWEHAARAGTTTRYPWGNELGFGHAVVQGHFPANEARNRPTNLLFEERQARQRFDALYPVESSPPNPWGIYDMIGNARETVDVIRDAPVSCTRRMPAHLCKEVLVRGGGVLSYKAPDLMTEVRFMFSYAGGDGRGYRLFRN